jgi:CrcB protein
MTIESAPAVGTARPRPVRPRLGVGIAVGAGGAIGALARYAVAGAWPVRAGTFPWSTLWINVSGSLVLGVVVTLVVERWPPTRYVRPFVGAGVCGGYTTWSTFMTEAALLVRHHRAGVTAAYVAVSLVAGLAATAAGIGSARRWPAAAPGRRR